MTSYLPSLLMLLAVWIYAFVDCLGTPYGQIRHLPKPAWVIVILLFGPVLVGPVAWLVAGRPRSRARRHDPLHDEHVPPAEPVHWVAPDDNPEFLRSLDERLRRDRNE
ncbi:PLD nuclease N-terminal domain-containing protein [Streptomyces sp. RB6PN25]|uniref:PLD nuclease N-terminal domain-containing protein n=1 Tax=Streptomyces humicola TaxID=2953240 RepID=A0ABT1PUA1_9ACTN|nr:PLD nuclease N-terminal domain-containing protein [Streptomyces humicola]MCQ4081237.1 PLD nuclease N-terminal domain-containing protein [Streptomyces humicola]